MRSVALPDGKQMDVLCYNTKSQNIHNLIRFTMFLCFTILGKEYPKRDQTAKR